MNIKELHDIIPVGVINGLELIKEANSNLRIAHFLSQVSHESNNFKSLDENLNYSPDGLLKIFPTHFTKGQAMQYQRDPARIASRAYANRMGNGNELSQDGWRFRGRGFLQITGKDNYIKFSEYCGKDCVADPDLLIREYSLEAAAWYFTMNNIWLLADKGSKESNIKEVTKAVNGGFNGLKDRIHLFNVIYELLE